MTMQVSERLILDGQELSMNDSDYYPKLPENDLRIINVHSRGICSDCWRKYIGTWKIEDNKLYLVNLEWGFKLKNETPILADWFTGMLKASQGKVIEDYEFYQVFEYELHIKINAGKVTNLEVIDNRKITNENESDFELWGLSMGYTLKGNWVSGTAYDLHTVSSEYLGQDEFGHDKYNNTRSEMGELVYQLKYKHDQSVVNKIVDLLQNIKGLEIFDVLIPIPPSNKNRGIQPVFSIAKELGRRLNISVHLDLLEKSVGSKELKGIDDPELRLEAIRSSMYVANNYDLLDKNVLLVDDLYRSGSTLRVATEVLYEKCKAKNVYVLTMTKTRSKR